MTVRNECQANTGLDETLSVRFLCCIQCRGQYDSVESERTGIPCGPGSPVAPGSPS